MALPNVTPAQAHGLTHATLLRAVEVMRRNEIPPDGNGDYWVKVDMSTFRVFTGLQVRAIWRDLYRQVRLARRLGAFRLRVVINGFEVA